MRKVLPAIVALLLMVVTSTVALAQEDDQEDEAPAEPADDPPGDDPAAPADDPPGDDPAAPADDPPGDDPAAPADDPPGDDPAAPADDPPGDEAAAPADDPPGDDPPGDDQPADDPPGDDAPGDDDQAGDGDDADVAPDDADYDADGSNGQDVDLDGDGDADAPIYDEDFGDVFGDEPQINSPEYLEEYGEPYDEWDVDGDGQDDTALKAEFEEAFAGVPDDVDPAALEARPDGAELDPASFLNLDLFRKMILLAKKKVLSRLEAKIETKTAARMTKISKGIFVISLLGLLLLLMPLFLAKKYPGQGGTLFKYSALAAFTFVVTVNLFGGVLLVLRGSQAAVGKQTNPQLALAGGFFDTLHDNAPRYAVIGKELFAPTLEQLQGATDEQPTVALLANGQKLAKDATVFLRLAKVFKQISFVFGVLPIVLFGVTMLLFVLAIKPTLIEIIKLPMQAASGGGGDDVFGRSMRRVGNELLATLCTIGILLVASLVAGAVLGRVVQPALETFLDYFVLAVTYLQFADGASSAMVFIMLFSVILFLVLSLAVTIVSMSTFLGKCQKIFQQRFNDKVPLSKHAKFFQWGALSLLIAQLYPLLYAHVAKLGIQAVNDKVMAGARDANAVSWKTLMLAGPLFLVFGFLVLLWLSQTLRALKYLIKYKPKQVVA